MVRMCCYRYVERPPLQKKTVCMMQRINKYKHNSVPLWTRRWIDGGDCAMPSHTLFISTLW